MKIKILVYQHRRDFKAIYVCEHCGAEDTEMGYDDRNFHDNVIPDMKCKKCGKSRNGIGIKGEFTQTQYPEGYQI